MAVVLAKQLSNKPVLSTDGAELGHVYNLTMDAKTGALESVLVEPSDSSVSGFETTDNGRLRVPARCIDDLSDFLIVRKPGT
ncbi:Sporulation protein YlmC, PRC-barrel domain family [Halorientalis persicus]|uniref:Sporulation protein YlmC, PRC-barrel domain family n=1 Tax=Halorientalis persicus TaxID=1367881 RepID=A0A1H8X2V4_9EURY|nr:PRC-barrel domain-containing protein [Halorientalis persicus]SEP33678.1 Sporulation protein YlmC, PRC-barrel domain family [Halorientalis persicus]